MVTVLEGRLDPFMTGVLYCHTIAACYEVGDVRMTRWTELAERWLTTVPAEATFGAMCAVHRAQLQLLRARHQAELRALHVVASLDVNRLDYAAQAWYVVAEVRRLRGEAALPKRTARRTPADTTRSRGGRCFGLPMVTPRVRWRRCSAPVQRQVRSPAPRPLCAALVEIAIAAGHPQNAAAAASELARRRHPPSHQDWRQWRQPRAVRCCWLRATSRRLCQCCATPVDAGTNSGLPTMPPAPARPAR